MKQILSTLLLLLLPGIFFACSCGGNSFFCLNVNPDYYVVMVKVGGQASSGLYTFDIIENIVNEVQDSSILLEAQDGVNCNESLQRFTVGDTMIFHLWPENFVYSSGDTLDYALTFCGRNFLTYKNGVVQGQIDSMTTEMPYSLLLQKLNPQTGGLPTPIPDRTLLAYPNPTSGMLTIVSQSPIKSVSMFTLQGRRTFWEYGFENPHEVKLDLISLQPRVYFLQLNGRKEETLKVVKH